ncbi:MAG: methylthioribulose 1-phosphate dehydratase [Pseudomonadales bacterium]|nr:methylthioribulose 1-phosphate dehydratase [Pseudomonadales bacterium]
MTTNVAPDVFRSIAKKLAVSGRQIYARGWSPATSSNFSIRINADSCAITVSGKPKGELSEQDIMIVDLQGIPLTPQKPSAETLLHTQLYRREPEIGAVLHTHSLAATVLSRLIKSREVVLSGYELLKAFDGIQTHDLTIKLPVFENTQDIAALASEVEQRMTKQGTGIAYLIRGHGLYTWGKTLSDCERHLEALEFLLQCELEKARVSGVSD